MNPAGEWKKNKTKSNRKKKKTLKKLRLLWRRPAGLHFPSRFKTFASLGAAGLSLGTIFTPTLHIVLEPKQQMHERLRSFSTLLATIVWRTKKQNKKTIKCEQQQQKMWVRVHCFCLQLSVWW